jgi:hypothetical protein
MTKDEALKMVIENLELQEFNTVNATLISYCKEALATNKESSLVQPAQEPVATVRSYNGLVGFHANQKQINILKDKHEHPLYLHPHQWQGLTDDEVDDFMFQSCDAENGYSITDLIRLVEQTLKEKNT